MPDPRWLVEISLRCAALAVLLRTLEIALNAGEFRRGRLWGWWPAPAAGRLRLRLEGPLSTAPVAVSVTVLRLVLAAAALLAPIEHAVTPWVAGGLLVSQLYVNRRLRRVYQSADVMLVYAQAAVAAALLAPGDDAVAAIALSFLGAQACLAYVVAGLVKVVSPEWRAGTTLAHLFQAGRFGMPAVGRLLAAYPQLARLGAWGTIVIELAIPFSILLPTAPFLVVLGAGAALHLAIAVLMGLHTFFWAFLAAYPGLYFLQAWISGRF